MSYRPIMDMWFLAHPKVKYHGAYPGGFPERARALLGVSIDDPVLHVCSGAIRQYPWRGLGPNDKTVDCDAELAPDYCLDVTKEPLPAGEWKAILADPPYTPEEADKYKSKSSRLPGPVFLLRKCLEAMPIGGRVGMLHYIVPQAQPNTRLVAAVGVLVGTNTRIRVYSVYEKTA